MRLTIVQDFEWKEDDGVWCLRPKEDVTKDIFMADVSPPFWRVWSALTGKALAVGNCTSDTEGKQRVEEKLKEAGLCK